MQWIYFDASALIKRYSQETGTPLVNEVFRLLPRSRMTCSTLGILEIVSVLVRKRNDGRLTQTLFE
jgi:predicted nucleic acid-binding protein